MAKSINISKISDAHANLMYADKMVDICTVYESIIMRYN